MNEKRKYKRFHCKLKVRFQYFDGNPDTIDIKTAQPVNCKGHILDISCGGLFIATNDRLGINRPVIVSFKTNNKIYSENGFIVRVGLMKNNPSEILKKFENLIVKEDSYIAIQFDNPLNEFSSNDVDG
jgi:hypothetical protein